MIDGDTIELANEQIVRYVGIYAPDNGQAFEEEATEANQKLVQDKTVTFEYDAYTSDRFGRVLAYVVVGGKNVSVELARLGLAKVTIYEDRRKLKYQDELLKAQDEAKKQKNGIWYKYKFDIMSLLTDNTGTVFIASLYRWNKSIFQSLLIQAI